MKKFLFFAAALLMFAAPAANAQRVKTDSEVAKLEKADATINDVKKNGKAATWIKHADAYVNAYILPTKELGQGVPVAVLQMNVGEPMGMVQGELMGMPMVVLQYDYVDVYVDPATYLIQGWDQKKSIKENLPETAIASLAKAYELDAKAESKIAPVAMTLANALSQQGEALNGVGRVLEASKCFDLAYRAQTVVPSIEENGLNLYNAGYLMTLYASGLQGDEAVAAFQQGAKYFEEALEAGITDGAGSIYYFLFHCYYGQKSLDRDLYLAKAKETLTTGIEKFPKNSNILDGLMQLYTAEEGVGDPAELVERIDNNLKEGESYDLWFGRGRVFNALKNYDECIYSFKQCARLNPADFDANYFVGYFIIEKANALLAEVNSRTDVEDYDAEVKKVDLVFAQAIEWLEKAHQINPSHLDSVTCLRQLCFRLREMDGMMDKYNHYKQIESQM
jgi:tetratricopeptide (TPR) repeat protein